MFSTRKGEVRQILQSAFSVLKICTLLGLQYFACSGKKIQQLNWIIQFHVRNDFVLCDRASENSIVKIKLVTLYERIFRKIQLFNVNIS